ncbi:hypothetical protein [Natrinema pallidum]|uniref:Uncharacterized protein n=1 Tax=Natrinema pallidum DSM 3751 TaxID=1227495 RepID=L9ZBE9_9EURY|nr:hypothetical protein [Natrinema pallidum]ELY83719.1 hypothetical protein C487_00375 [Natrinema pallidum DSM 3751]
MNAKIDGEDDRGIGVAVTDNKGVGHRIALGTDGEFQTHECDIYADKPADRTPEENELNEQARRFAQYYVYCERGYDTVTPRRIHPERINAVRVAVASLSEAEFERYFGDLYRQLRSYDDSAVNRTIDIPDEATSADSLLYRKHVYLGLNPLETELGAEADAIAARHGLDLAADRLDSMSPEDISDAELDDWRAATAELGALAETADIDLSEGLQLAGVSSLRAVYLDDRGEEHVTNADDPFDRQPDAWIELPVMDPGSLPEFQAYINHNLACQVRDCFVRMGLEPPQPFRILGYGDFEAAEQYKRLDLYPNYVDPHEETAFADGYTGSNAGPTQ